MACDECKELRELLKIKQELLNNRERFVDDLFKSRAFGFLLDAALESSDEEERVLLLETKRLMNEIKSIECGAV